MDEDYEINRQACYRRDGYRCRHCGYRGGLHAHHLVYRSHSGEDSLDNLVTLCASCHRGLHDGKLVISVVDGKILYERKGNWKPT